MQRTATKFGFENNFRKMVRTEHCLSQTDFLYIQ